MGYCSVGLAFTYSHICYSRISRSSHVLLFICPDVDACGVDVDAYGVAVENVPG